MSAHIPHHSSLLSAIALVLCAQSAWLFAKDAKLKPEELLAKHLTSIGAPDARAAIKNRVLAGTVRVTFIQGGHGTLDGKANIFSDGQKTRFGFAIGGADYNGEQVGFDGDKVTVGQVRPGVRSTLSAFLYVYTVLLKEGLLGGTLITGWPLLDEPGRQFKLEYTGLKKIEGRQLHEIKYRPKKGAGDLRISLYFDPDTFRHVYSQYQLIQPAQMGARPELSSGQRDTIYTLIERFNNFEATDGVTIPRAHKIGFTIEGQAATFMASWEIVLDQIAHNSQMDPAFFKVQ